MPTCHIKVRRTTSFQILGDVHPSNIPNIKLPNILWLISYNVNLAVHLFIQFGNAASINRKYKFDFYIKIGIV